MAALVISCHFAWQEDQRILSVTARTRYSSKFVKETVNLVNIKVSISYKQTGGKDAYTWKKPTSIVAYSIRMF